jgi:hypothetical protein
MLLGCRDPNNFYIADDMSVTEIEVEGVHTFLWQSFYYFCIVDTIRIEGVIVSLASLSVYIVELDCVLTIKRGNIPFL